MFDDYISDDLLNNPVYRECLKFYNTYQNLVDSLVPHTSRRWIACGVVFVLFTLRVIIKKGWYIVCYALNLYLLNLFLAFLTPKFDPSLEQEMRNESIEEGTSEETQGLQQDDDDFKPFIRRLPEFKFWYNAIKAITISFCLTFFSIFDVPVFWPILVFYFIILFALTMRKQIQHMIKYRYLPFDLGKKKYRPLQ